MNAPLNQAIGLVIFVMGRGGGGLRVGFVAFGGSQLSRLITGHNFLRYFVGSLLPEFKVCEHKPKYKVRKLQTKRSFERIFLVYNK